MPSGLVGGIWAPRCFNKSNVIIICRTNRTLGLKENGGVVESYIMENLA